MGLHILKGLHIQITSSATSSFTTRGGAAMSQQLKIDKYCTGTKLPQAADLASLVSSDL